MTLTLHAHCGYASYKNGSSTWGSDEHTAHKYVLALKGRPINRYARLKRLNGSKVEISSENPEPAFDVFGEWAAQVLRRNGLARALIVPIPGSECVAYDKDKKGARLAKAITDQLPSASYAAALRWAEQWAKASKGGERDPYALKGNLVARRPRVDRPVVLLDDVATSGGHLVAAAWALRELGLSVDLAIVAGRTVYEPPVKGMFSIPTEDIEAQYDF